MTHRYLVSLLYPLVLH